MEAFGALDCGGEAVWWPSSRLLEEVQRKSTDFNVIWFYGSPAWIASGTPHGEPLEDALDGWVRRNRAVLNLRGLLGPRLRLVNIEAASALSVPASRAHSHHLFRALLGWWGPTYQGMYEVLEAAAWKPLGDRRARLEQLSESQLLATMDGFMHEVRQAWEAIEEARADKLLAHLQETQEDLESVLLERETVRSQLAASRDDHEQEVLERQELERQLATTRKQVEKLQQEERATRDRLADLRRLSDETAQELAASTVKVQALEQHLAAEGEGKRALQARIAASEEARNKLKRELDILKGECRELQARNIEAMRQIRDMADERARDAAGPQPGTTLRHGVVRLLPALRRRRQDSFPSERLAAIELIRESEFFDEAWYLDTYPDVREAKLDPVEHFLDFGWKEFRNPGPHFDTTYYLANNIDVAKSGLNPLLHFINHGAAEGRRPQHSVGNA